MNNQTKRIAVLGAGGFIAAALGVLPATAQSNPWAPAQTTVPVEVNVEPIAEIQFPDGTSGLHLYVPPPNSTIPATGLRFLVRGNALASVSATPDQFMLVSPYFLNNINLGPRYLGKADLPGGGSIGYNIQVEFPIGQSAALPLTNGAGTPGLIANLALAGGEETGFLHLLASHRWTSDATMPAVGDYSGHVIVTISAGSL